MLRLKLSTIVTVVCCFRLVFSNCRDTTLDFCGNDQTIPFETFTDQGEDICQQICRGVYPDRCIFFIYDRENELCELYDIEEQIYVDSCKRTTGTPKPPLAECKDSNDPCTKFTEGYCIYEGDLLENAGDISSATACQFLCEVYKNGTKSCNYFDYNADERNCQLLSSSSRTCDLIRGPPTPTMKECSDIPTTSTTIAPSDEFMVCVNVVDATTNNPITNVDFISTENGSPSSTDLDDPDGEICYSVPGGTDFEVTVQKDGFNDGVRNGLIEKNENWVIAMNPITGDDRIILTWSEQPPDLDMHLFICDRGCEVFYGNKNCENVNLDVDDTTGNGPETMTFASQAPLDQTYVVWIYDYAPNPNVPLSDSEGKVDLFSAGGDKISLDVPSDTSGRYWIIGTFNGIEGLGGIDVSNTIVSEFNIDDLCGTRQTI